MAGTVDYVRVTLEKSYALVKARADRIFIDLLKLSAGQTLAGFTGLILIAGLAVVLLGASLTDIARTGTLPQSILANAAIAALLIGPVFAMAMLIANAIQSVGFNVIHNSSAGKPTDLVGQARKNFWPVVKLNVLTWAAMLLLLVPILVSVPLGGMLNGIAGAAPLCILTVLSAIALVLFVFFTQFSTAEVVLGGKGPIAAMKASASLVKENLLGVIIIDVLLGVLAMAFSVVSGTLQKVLELILQTFSEGGTAGLAVGFAIYICGIVVVSVIIGAITQTVLLPIIYNFWNGKKG